jgi:hypothetical protein
MHQSFLQYLRLFRDIPAADEVLLTQALRPHTLPENEVLVRPG